jgi:hypothetical protein
MPATGLAISAYGSTPASKVVRSRTWTAQIRTVVPDVAEALFIDTAVKSSVASGLPDNVVFPGSWGSWLLPGGERSY